MTLSIVQTPLGVQFAVKAVPGSSRDRIVGLHGEALKITIAAPPEHGRANVRLLELLAATLSVPRPEVELVRGATTARKHVLVRGLSPDELRARLGV